MGVSGSNPLGGLSGPDVLENGDYRLWPYGDRDMADKKKSPVEKIALQCTECKRKNYTTEKNRRNNPNKLELMKYCPFERKHTLHRETKVK